MEKMHSPRNVLLVYPETPQNSYWSFSRALGMIGKKVNSPPLGLLTVAGMLPPDEFSARLVDMNATPLTEADLEWADLIFLSAMIAQKDSLAAVLQRCKETGKTIVAGGPFPSSAYGDFPDVDCFVIGEAEGVWDLFLADLRAGNLKPAYAAPVRLEEAEALSRHFGPRASVVVVERHPDINLAPLPRFDLLDMSAYALMPVQASRGCPVGCEFCDIWRRYGRLARNKNYEFLKRELDELYRLGWRDTVFLVDDNFIGNKARAKALLGELIVWQRAHGWPFAFLTEATLSMADDDELLALMSEAGFTSVFVGIETPCAESLKETRKHINTVGSMAEKVAKIQAHGIQLMSGFIIGFDADPDDIARRMSDCIQKMGIPQAMVGLLTALPDTDLHERLAAESRIKFNTTGNNTHNFAINFLPARPEEKVVEDYKKILDSAYPENMKSYFQRCAVLRKRWPSRRRRKLGSMGAGMKVKALLTYLSVSFRSKYRFQAWWFLLSTLAVKPGFFEEAVTLGVKGHHLWAITRAALEVERMREFMLERLRRLSLVMQEKQASLLASATEHGIKTTNELSNALQAFFRSASRVNAQEELREIYRWAAEIVQEADTYREHIRDEAIRRYRLLSRDARGVLKSEFDRFMQEADQLFRNWNLEAPAAT